MTLELKLTPTELRYVATCYPFHDRLHYEDAVAWKKNLLPLSEREDSYTLPLDQAGCAFPTLLKRAEAGLFLKYSVQEYFESLEGHGHNNTMAPLAQKLLNPSFVKKFAEKQTPGVDPGVWLERTLKHLEHCSVRVAKRDGEVWWFGGYRKSMPIDFDRFNTHSDYVFVHGFEDGKAVAIRPASEKDFNRFKAFFDNYAIR